MYKKLSLEEVKAIELEILKYVKKICDDNKLKYFLCGGTLLGAIRHKGFIPWDDDIDIALPRNDYMKLIDILKGGHRYRCLSYYDNEDYHYPYAKVIDTHTILIEHDQYPIKGLGVCIDIFPIDGLPRDSWRVWYHMTKLKVFRKMLGLSLQKYPSSNVVKYITRSFSRIIGWKRWIRYVERLATKYDFNNGDKVGCIVAGYFEKEVVSKGVFEKTIDVEFEGEIFPAPVGYDEYLTSLYGDYMKLPPEEKRISPHNYEAYLIS